MLGWARDLDDLDLLCIIVDPQNGSVRIEDTQTATGRSIIEIK